MRRNRPFDIAQSTRHHAGTNLPILRFNHRCILSGEWNILRRIFLMSRRTIHPKLDQFQLSTFLCQLHIRTFGVKNTCIRKHPLCTAASDDTVIPLRVQMPQRPFIDEGHRRKPLMRMRWHPDLRRMLSARIGFPPMMNQQKRVYLLRRPTRERLQNRHPTHVHFISPRHLIYFSHNFYILYLIVSTTIFYAWFILGFWACPLLSFASAQEAGVGLSRGSVLAALGPAAFAAALPIPHAKMPFHSTNYRLNLSFSLDLIHLLIRIGVFFLLSQVIVIHKKYSMKFNGIMVFVLIFLSKFFMFAQDPVCGIASGPSGLQSFQEYDPELASSNFCIKVYFILYGDRDENNNCVDLVPLGRQNSVINDLNSAFPSSIQFYYDETETEIYCEKDLISLTNACGYLNNDFGIQKPTDGIIIHLASDNVAPGGPNGFAKSIPSKEFYVGSTDNGVPNSKNKGLLAHEMGHCLGLHHTFFGEPSVGQPPCDEVRDCDGTIIASSNPDSNDGISSTGRDPNGDTNDCEAITNNGKCNDPNYSYPDIPFDNYMSYYWDCIERFTSDQINRMKFEIENMFGSNPLESCCKLPQNADHIISEDEEWDSDDDVSKVTIEQGATLTVSSGAVISFDAAGEIIIDGGQLILNNATLQLSSSCGDNQWQGIKMSGCGNQIQSDNSTIRDAAVGIHIENMNNCGTVALDMDEGSSIENCTRGLLIQNSIAQFDLTETYFRDNNIAVEVIEGGNLVFDDCHFDNNGFFDAEPTVEFDPIGIRLVNAKVDFLESNLFDNTTLFAWGKHPMSPRLKIGESEKDKCTFTGGNGYYLLATSGVSGGLAFMVENTRFLNALYGNFFWGANEYF